MKRLGVLACIVLLSIGVFGDFSLPQKTYAQETTPIAVSYDYFQGMMAAANTAANTAYDTSLSTYQAQLTAEQFTAIKKIYDTYKSVSNSNYQAYLAAFNAEKTKGSTPYDAQIKGIQAWLNSMDTGSNLVATRAYTSSKFKSAYNNYVKKTQTILRATKEIQANPSLAGSQQIAAQTDPTTIINAAVGNTTIPVKRADDKPNECSLVGGNLVGCINTLISWIIQNTLLQIAGWLAWLAANMFNYAIQIGVLNFSQWAPDTLYPIWLIVRQAVSLVVVFAGLYLGFMYIIGRDEKFKKYIPWVVMFALFVNFSYPLARTAVDISNIVSLNIYSATVGNKALTASISSTDTAGSIIMNKLGLQGLVMGVVASNNTSGAIQAERSIGTLNSIPAALAAVCFVLYTAYILFMLTGIIIMRTVALVMLIVVSPILLVDAVLPLLGEWAQKIRKIFFEQLIVGPVFMIMFALALKFIDVFSIASNTAGNSITTLGADSSVKTFFNLIMMLIVLHFTYKITKNTAGAIGNFASDAMGKVGGLGLGLAAGGLAMAGRAGATKFIEGAEKRGWVSQDPNSASRRITNTLKNSTFDIRNSKTIAQGAGAIGFGSGLLGVGMGSGSSKTYQINKDKQTKRQSTFLAGVGSEASNNYKTTHEEDTYYKADVVAEDGKVLHKKGDIENRKGEVNKTAVASRADYVKKQLDSATFLTKEQKLKNLEVEVDTQTNNTLSDYKKLSRGEKASGKAKLTQELERLKASDPTFETPKTKALIRAVHDINQEEVAMKKALDIEIEEAFAKYKRTSTNNQAKYLESLSSDVRKAVDEKLPKALEVAPSASKKVLTGTPDLSGLSLETETEVAARTGGTSPTIPSATTVSTAPTPIVTAPTIADTDWGKYETTAVSRKNTAPTDGTVRETFSEKRKRLAGKVGT